MPHYFAFGSNMHRLRLERRVGPVVDHGCAMLADHLHGFCKRGTDGSGKGNIQPRIGCQVHGVLYEVSDAQLEVLATYEPGYARVELTAHARGEAIVVVSFRADMWVPGLAPTEQYLEHYRRGMREHDLPAAYVREVLASVVTPRPGGRGSPGRSG